MKKKSFIIMSSIAAIVVVAVLISSAVWPVINKVETGRTPEYAELGPSYYSTEPMRVLKESKAAADGLESMRILDSTGSGFTATMGSWMPLMDATMRVDIKPVTEYVTSVSVVSETPLLAGDLGQNARNIRKFIQALDERLGSVRFKPSLAKQE